jgi:hypothetical protein
MQNTRRRVEVLAFLEALRVELAARTAFKEAETPENLTAWATARNQLEDTKRNLG